MDHIPMINKAQVAGMTFPTRLHQKNSCQQSNFSLIQLKFGQAHCKVKYRLHKQAKPAMVKLILLQKQTILEGEGFVVWVIPACCTEAHDLHATGLEKEDLIIHIQLLITHHSENETLHSLIWNARPKKLTLQA